MRALSSASKWWLAVHQDSTWVTLRRLTLSAAAWAALQVQVPPLGESITDGTIASILKKPGDSVEEDEPLLQIETDKVTIDVRSPQAGTVETILVKEEDTVTVGHVVASIIDKSSDSSGGEHQDSSLAAGGQSDTNTSQNATAITDDVAPVVEKARVPSISFPRRRTPQGDVISLLPAGQAAEYANPAFASSFASSPTTTKSTTKSTTTTATQAAPIRSAPEPPRLFLKVPPRTGPAVRRPSALRKELSDREIEAIMLGGLND